MIVRAWPWNFVLLLSMYRVSGQECLENYADVEKALLDDPENSYQIAKAFFIPRSEGETLCATVFYYLGLNSTEEPSKSNCPSVTLGRNQEFHGCSKWKWCVNTFYMDLIITQLQLFSFFIIYEKTAEIELRIPPFCVGNETMYEYLLHATNSLKLYAEGEGTIGEGRPFLGFAARFISPNKLEPLIKDVNQDSLDVLFDSTKLLNSEFNKVDSVFLLISLFALPSFIAPLSGILFMDLQKKVRRKITEEIGDLYPYIFALVLACICGNITMILFQVASFNKGGPWYYVIPYSWLMILISIQFITSLLLTYKFMSQRSEIKGWRHYYCNLFFWLHTCLLWVVLTTVLMLSWHAVFIMLGFILNPFRALILTIIYATGTICVIIMFSVIFSFCQLIFKCIRAKKFHTFFVAIYLFLMVSILTFIISYISFMFRINISGQGTFESSSLIEWANNLLPPLILVTLTWFLRKLLKLPMKIKYDKNVQKQDIETDEAATESNEDSSGRAESIL